MDLTRKKSERPPERMSRWSARASRERVRTLLRGARGFLFAADEDFGIAPVEAQACGIPVVAYGRGGALETIRDAGQRRADGGVFPRNRRRTPSFVPFARLEELADADLAVDCRLNAERFSEERFRREFAAFVQQEWLRFGACNIVRAVRSTTSTLMLEMH